MLTHLSLKNFKAWRDTGDMRLAPLTVIFGTNSSGKSSLGHLLLALKQTVSLTDRKRALHLGDDQSLIDLGTFEDCIHQHHIDKELEFQLRWRMPHELTVKNALNHQESYSGKEISLTSILQADATQQPLTTSFEYDLFKSGEVCLSVKHQREGKKGKLDCEPLRLVYAQGRIWPLEPPEKFYRFADRTLSRFQNADFLAEFSLETERLLERFYYLGPLRSYPKRVYQWSGDTPPDVGLQGEYSIAAMLAATQAGRQFSFGRGKKKKRFDTMIADWLKRLGIIHQFSVNPIAEGRKEYEVLVQTHPGAPEVKLTDVGFGISQVLPALVQAFYVPKDAIVWMEQPEIHLHPMVQANLADAFIAAIKAKENGRDRNIQLIIESHSEHFLSRLQRRVAEGEITPDDVAIYFVNQRNKEAELEPLRLNEYGDIENWPDNFFGDEMADIAARTMAAMQRKAAAAGGA